MTTARSSFVARARRAVGAVVGALAMAMTALTAPPAPPADAQTPTPPPQPGLNDFGGPGPCAITYTEAPSVYYPGRTVWVVEPDGPAVPTRTRGTCDDSSRPVVLLAHGFRMCSDNPQSQPVFYWGLVSNLVSNGFIVAYPNYCATSLADFGGDGTPTYEMVDVGFQQAMSMTERENLAHLGVWGHSFGGGMAPWLAERAVSRGAGTQSLWVASYAPFRPLKGGTATNPQFVLPGRTRSLHVIYQHDDICALLVWAGCDVPGWSAEIYERMPQPGAQRWGLLVRSDCSHVPASGCNSSITETLRADHFTPASFDYDGSRAESHLRWFSVYRNVHRLYDCARNGGASCTAPRTSMGTWSDGVAATPATNCTPTSCP